MYLTHFVTILITILTGVAYKCIASVILSAKNVTALVNQDEVAKELGVNTDKDDAAAVASRKEADTMKYALIDAYSAMSSAILVQVKLLSTEIDKVCAGTVPLGTSGVTGETSTSIPVGTPVQDPTEGTVEKTEAEAEAVTTLPVPSSSSSAAAAAAAAATLPSSSSSAPVPVSAETITTGKVSHDITKLLEMRIQAYRDFDAACKQLQRWDDLNSDKHWLLCISRLKLRNQWGQALKKITDLSLSSADNKSKGEPVSREVLNEVPYRTVPYHTVLYHTILYRTVPYPNPTQALHCS